jgi:hypothetical protein
MKSELEEVISICCPLAQANALLGHFFREHGNSAGDTARLDLLMNISVPGLAEPLSLQRSVIATIQPLHLPGQMTSSYALQWAPETAGPFPLFSGSLHIESAEDFGTFRLKLVGEYTPPLGLIGKAFDISIGTHIAHATANQLLGSIKAFLEHEFDEAEQRKAIPTPGEITVNTN